jgi:putative two-component system response regulator
MQTHSEIGKKIIGEHSSPLLKTALIVAYEHHERWDGKVYPCGIADEAIHLYGRIAAVADVFDVLTSKRGYKDAWTFDEAYSYILAESGKYFDPRVVNAFIQCVPQIKEIMNLYSDDKTIKSS